jgi:hypothetical protein
MKIGIIIIFHNNEGDIDSNFLITHFLKAKNLEMCLVNNDSGDNTYKILKEIKEVCENVSLVNIKKFKSDSSAVRAGARYMFNQFDLNHLGYFFTNNLNIKSQALNVLIKAISENQKDIIKYNLTVLNEQETKPTMFQSLFSVIDYLKKIKIENQLVNLY